MAQTEKENDKGVIAYNLNIGDEVVVGNDRYGYVQGHFIITAFNGCKAHLLDRSNGHFAFAWCDDCHKTGKHFSIEDLFEKEEHR